jgi:hypothetical protein
MAELDFVFGIFPVNFRKAEQGEDLTKFKPHHIKWRKAKESDDLSAYQEANRRLEKKKWYVADKVPTYFDGLQAGDTVAMILGGSGDRFAYALARRGEEIGARVLRIPTFVFSRFRQGKEKENDACELAGLAIHNECLFFETTIRDRSTIRVREALALRIFAMKARIACEQQLRSSLIGRIFCDEEGGYPEGGIELAYEKEKANDLIIAGMMKEEARRNKELTAAVEAHPAYQILGQIEGLGPMIAARLIAAIIDIRRFETDAKLKKFCGVHVLDDGKFARRRTGVVANWHPDARQALYLLGDQFNRRPDSVWGRKLREYKIKFRETHPEVLCKTCGCSWDECGKKDKAETEARTNPDYKEFSSSSSDGGVDSQSPQKTIKTKTHSKIYTDGHIHKMATWRTLTKFAEWLFVEWRKLENDKIVVEKAA